MNISVLSRNNPSGFFKHSDGGGGYSFSVLFPPNISVLHFCKSFNYRIKSQQKWACDLLGYESYSGPNLGQQLFFPVANVAVYLILLLGGTATGMHLGQPISNIGLEHRARKFCNRSAVLCWDRFLTTLRFISSA